MKQVNRQLDASLRMYAFQRMYPSRKAQRELLDNLTKYLMLFQIAQRAGYATEEAIQMIDDMPQAKALICSADAVSKIAY